VRRPLQINFSENLEEVHVSINAGPVDRLEQVRVTQQPGGETRQVVTENVNARKRQTLQRVSALAGFFFSLLEGLIGLRILLKLLEANPSNAFASAVYNFTGLFVAPFNSLIGNPVAAGGRVLEITSIVAIIVYALIAWAIIRLVWLVFYQPSARTVTTYEIDQSPRGG
jgi:hypothetical protein